MKTTLITGATEGIGYEFSKLFADKGFNLVLIARNERKLAEMRNQLSANNIDVRTYAKDLSELNNAKFVYEDLKKQHIKIDYLVNNAGFGINNDFIDIDWEDELQMYNLNMITLAYFTKVFARDMREHGFGRILNLASTGAFQPGPRMAGYCASKAFVLSLSEAVNRELKGTNVSVTTLCPGVTDTKFHDVANSQNMFMARVMTHATAEEVAVYGVKIMEKQKSFAIHGFLNRLVVLLERFMPRKLLVSMADKMLR